MLKLERTTHRHLNVIVPDRERFLNKPLLTAFAIAAAIHLLLFLTFQITPLALRLNEREYPPMIVQALMPSGATVVAAASPAPQIRDNLPPIPLTQPVITQIPAFISVRHIDDIKQNHNSANLFTHLEKDIYNVPIASKHPPADKPAIAVIISGPLSTGTLVKNGLPLTSTLIQNSASEQRVVYSVVADSPSGKIVWFAIKEPSQSSQLDKLAEKILLEMQFARNTLDFMVDGEIELHFHHSADSS